MEKNLNILETAKSYKKNTNNIKPDQVPPSLRESDSHLSGSLFFYSVLYSEVRN